MKVCSKCHIEKEENEFCRNGKSVVCLDCRKSYEKQWRKNHANALAEYNKKYYIDNISEIKKWRKSYYAKNRTDAIKKAKDWAFANKEKRKQICDRWVQNNSNRSAEIKRKWSTKNEANLNEKSRQNNKTDRIKQIKAKSQKRAIDSLNDSYVKELLKNDGFYDKDKIPSDIIEIKRTLLKIKRHAKEKAKAAIN